MCHLVEVRSEAELAAVEALLTMAVAWTEHQRPPTVTPKPQQKAKPTITTSTPTQPGKKMRTSSFEPKSFEPNQKRQSVILSVDCNGQVKKCENPTPSPKLIPVLTDENSTSPTVPIQPSKSKSGRVVKRTKRFISLSDEENTPPNSPKTMPMQGKRTKSTEDKNVSKTIEEIHPAKKIKTEPTSKSKNISINGSISKAKLDIFGKNIQAQIQSDMVRHSRLFEAAYEIGRSIKSDTIVDFQFRAVENLIAYKSEIDAKRNQIFTNRVSKITELMQKFRAIGNRQRACDEFSSRFKATTSSQWKPFAEDLVRASNIADYKMMQVTKRPLVQFLVDEFVKQNHTKEKARSLLIEVLKLLPDRPEIRNEFINSHLPRVVAAHKQATKKSRAITIKKEMGEINSAFQYYF